MDEDRNGEVYYAEFKEFMRDEGHNYYVYVNKDLFHRLDGEDHGSLDFWNVTTLCYIIKSGRSFCRGCDEFLTSVYLACLKCFESASGPCCIFVLCYEDTDYNLDHRPRDHPQFLDSYYLLEAQRLLAIDHLPWLSAKPSYRGSPSPSTSSNDIVLLRSRLVSSCLDIFIEKSAASVSAWLLVQLCDKNTVSVDEGQVTTALTTF